MATGRSNALRVESDIANNSDEELLIPRRSDSRNAEVLLDDRVACQGEPQRRRITYEDAIKHAGFGLFHFKLLLLCGLGLLGNTFLILSVFLVLPIAACEFHLTEKENNWFSNILFFGVLVGGVLFAGLGDWYGRRLVLISCLVVSASFGFASSLAQDFPQFTAFRFFSGVGIGGSIPVLFAYFAEFQPKSYRGLMLSCLSTFWVFGNILVSGLAWLMVPYKFGIERDGFHYNSWHIFLSLCIMPNLVSALLMFLMPESPLHLMETGRDCEAYDVFQSIFEDNHRQLLPSEFEMRVNRLYWSIDHMNSLVESQRITPKYDNICAFLSSFLALFRSWLRLFSAVLIRRFLTIVFIFILLSFGYYGYFMWFLKLSDRFKNIDETGGTVCMPFNYTEDSEPSKRCYSSEHFYRDNVIVALCNLPGCILTIVLIDRVGRKFLLALGMFLSGIVVFFVWLVQSHLQGILMSCIFSCVSVVGWNALNVLAVEIFPANLRCSAFGLLTGIAAMASFCGIETSALLVHTSCAVPIVLIAVLLAIGGLLGLLLPNSCQVDLI